MMLETNNKLHLKLTSNINPPFFIEKITNSFFQKIILKIIQIKNYTFNQKDNKKNTYKTIKSPDIKLSSLNIKLNKYNN